MAPWLSSAKAATTASSSCCRAPVSRRSALPKARILVVDDEAVFRKNLVRSLLAHDYDVRESETAAEALQQYKAFRRTCCCWA